MIEQAEAIPYMSVNNDIHSGNITKNGILLDWSDTINTCASAAMLRPYYQLAETYGAKTAQTLQNHYLTTLANTLKINTRHLNQTLEAACTIGILIKIELFIKISQNTPSHQQPAIEAAENWFKEIPKIKNREKIWKNLP